MDPIINLVCIAAWIACMWMAISAKSRSARLERLVEEMRTQMRGLENDLRHAGQSREERPTTPPAPATPPHVEATPPPLPTRSFLVAARQQAAATPPTPAAPQPIKQEAQPLDWEQFMGAKLFAWIGGFALFLGIGFFVKYSFEHNLIPPEMRVAIGFAAGLALVAGGLMMKRKENVVTAQTLCATGIVVLYAVTFACRSYYHFAFFTEATTFAIMALITVAAFLLSVGMNALVVGVLGVAGGFLTPLLLDDGQDHPLALFGYIALLNIGLLTIAQRQRWRALPILGAIGTVMTEIMWIARYFYINGYAQGNKVLEVMTVLAGFQSLFLAATWWAGRAGRREHAPGNGARLVALAALLGAFFFLCFPSLCSSPLRLCAYLFVVDLGLIALSLLPRAGAWLRAIAGAGAFGFLGLWTADYLTPQNLTIALACYFVFALLHTALPLVLRHFTKSGPAPWWCQVFPAAALLLVMLPVFQYSSPTFLVWPFVLAMDAMAVLVAVATASLAPVIVLLLLTLVALGSMIGQIPTDLTGLPGGLGMIAVFAVFFFAASIWAARRLSTTDSDPPHILGGMNNPANIAVQLPALSAILPFLLLIMVIVRLPLHDPDPVFELGLLLVALLLTLTTFLGIEELPFVALLCVLGIEYTWRESSIALPDATRLSLAWYLVFYAVFTVFPFAFRGRFAEKRGPWRASSMAGPLHFPLVYGLARKLYPAIEPGMIAAIFAVPPSLGMAWLVRKHPAPNPARITQWAHYGSAALFFITLIFPLQFHRETITISWALEGASLCWLFRRVPHPGLRLTGVALLTVAFARLGLNPLVLEYHARAAYPVFNWYLYAFGVVSASLFLAGKLLAPPRNLALGINVEPPFYIMGTVLAFLLVNIEIADYFTQPGTPVLTFDFSGNFARDMSYSIAWALFALMLLIVGMGRRNALVRYGGLGLLAVTVLKLFLHDLSQLDQLYRIGAFIAVAVIAILASFLYQRFIGLPERATEPVPK
jgi:hypothetical protein